MINSIYTPMKFFLRELISNASDALDKLAYRALTDESVGLSRSDFAITITRDEKNKLLTVSDNGIGMSKDEMEQNLGTICKAARCSLKRRWISRTMWTSSASSAGFYLRLWWRTTSPSSPRQFGAAGSVDVAVLRRRRLYHDGLRAGGPRDRHHFKIKEDTEAEKFSRFLQQYELQNLIKKYLTTSAIPSRWRWRPPAW